MTQPASPEPPQPEAWPLPNPAGSPSAQPPAMRRVLVLVLLLLAVVHIISSLPVILAAWQDRELSHRVEVINPAASELLSAAHHLGYERGRAYVVLHQALGPQEAAGELAFIRQRRQEGVAALERSLALLTQAQMPPAPQLAQRLAQARDQVQALQARVDRDLLAQPGQRDPALPGAWLAAMNQVMDGLDDLMAQLARNLSQMNRGLARLSIFRLHLIALRNNMGQEVAQLAAVMASGRSQDQDSYQRCLVLRGQTSQQLHTLEYFARGGSDPRLSQALAEFSRLLAQYRQQADQVLRAAWQGGPYHLTTAKYLTMGRQVLDGLGDLGQIVRVLADERARELGREAGDALFWQFVTLIVVLGCILLGLLVTLRRVVRPAAAAMERTLSLLSATLESTADGILVSDGQGRLLLWNQKFLELWRLEERDLAERHEQKALAKVTAMLEDPQGFLDTVRQLYAQPEAHGFDLLRFNDGRVFERYSQPQRIGQEVVGRVWSFRDVSEREQARQALQDSQEHLRTIAENAPAYILELDRQGRITYTNRMPPGLGTEGLIGRTIAEWVPSQQRHQVEEALALVLTSGQAVEYRAQGPGSGGPQTPYQVRLSPVLARGEVVSVVAVVVNIGQIVAVEERLRGREGQLRMLLESTRAVPWTIDLASDRFTYMGPRMVEVLGYPPESWTDLESWASRIDPRDRQQAVKFCRHQTRQGRDHEFALRMIAADGRVVWILDTISVIMGPRGPSSLVGFMRDITVQKEAEEALRESEERYRFLVDSAGVVVWRGRPGSFDFSFVSPEAENLLGYPASQWVSEPDFWLKHLHPEDRDRASEAHRSAAADLTPHEFDYRMIAADGRVVWVRDIVSFEVVEGQVKGVVGVLVDVTDRRQAEEALRQSQAATRGLLDATNDSVILLDPEFKILAVNEAAARRLRLPQASLLGRGLLELVPEEFGQKLRDHLQELMQGGQPLRWRQEQAGHHFDNHLYPVLDQQKRVTGIALYSRDISEAVQAGQKQAELERQLFQAQKMEAIGTLAGGIAHDFNNILAAVLGFAEIAQEQAQAGGDNRHELGQIIHAAERARDLVRRILAFSRQAASDKRPMSLNQAVRQAVVLLERTLPKMIALDISLGRELPAINADPTQMEQVLMNLATNASHAMPQGGRLIITTQDVMVEGMICPVCAQYFQGRHLLLTVNDSGLGMEPQTQAKMFDPFFTTKAVGQGTGLGLATVYGIVKAHDGHIQCRSAPGAGTTFQIYLPAHSPAQGPEEDRLAPDQALPGGHETILLVDDEDLLREIGQHILGQAGYQVRLAASGEQALEVFGQPGPPPDLVLLDLGMPGMGGELAMHEILARQPQARVVISSGYAAAVRARQLLKQGARAFVSKPFRRAELLTTIRQVLDHAQPPAGSG